MPLNATDYELTDEFARSVDAYIFDHQVGLVLFRAADDAQVGSGVLVTIGDLPLIATAGHNLAGVRHDRIAIVHSEEARYAEIHPVRTRFTSTARGATDLGYIELDTAESTGIEKRFVSLDQIEPSYSARSDDFAVLHGFPREFVPHDRLQAGWFSLGSMGFLTSFVDPSAVPFDSTPGTDVVCDWPEDGVHCDTGARTTNPHPEGLSGCGIWAIDRQVPGSGIWSPDRARLVAIERAWREPQRMIVGTHIRHWLALIAEDYPRLAGVIQEHYP